MPSLSTTLLFMTAGLALNLTPGPDMLYVATRSSSEGRGAGLASALGIFAGCLFHIAAVALGLAALVERVPAAFEVVRWAGAGYLVYLGARALRGTAAAGTGLLPAPAGQRAVFVQGALTNMLNPKVALFFLAFVPQFLEPARGPAWLQVVGLGMLFNTTGLLVNGTVALVASGATSWLRSSSTTRGLLERLTGLVFLGLGARLLLSRRPAVGP